MKTDRERIYLAALLHDIGKFYQRADNGSVKNSQFLSAHCKNESSFCPLTADGNYTHKHVLWTAQFIEEYSPVFNKLVNNTDIIGYDNLLVLSASHHLKNDQLSPLGQIIKDADCLSSGMDRNSGIALKDSQDETINGWNAFLKKRMTSILESIDSNSSNCYYHIPVTSLRLDKSFFPQKDFQESPDYASLWNDFINEFKFIQANTYRAFSETLLNLLFKYTTTIPSSTINFPDVSLFDHLKTTAAIAVCLYDYKNNDAASDNEFLLIGADFCGIQAYIYQIISKYAGKNLKGRSFYIRMISDAIVRFILKELNLFQSNVIYNSGGGFYILAPNTIEIKEKFDKAIKQIEDFLFKTHGTTLYVAIDCVELSRNALMHSNGESINDTWNKLFQKRDLKKSTKFANELIKKYDSFFEPILMGGDAKRDSITGDEFLPNEKIFKEGELLLKESTFKQIIIGEKLHNTNLIVIKEGEPLPYWTDKVNIKIPNFALNYYFIDSESELETMKEQLRASADEVTIITLNGKNGNCDFMHSINGINNIYSLDFYGGNESDKKGIKTFEEICQNENLSRLGVLRMDVDNLGNIFKCGIPKERATLSRFAALSRSFDFFFSGYLNSIWREIAPENSRIIYSGGDDVFIVGQWDITIELAKKIKSDFAEFTCNNPSFSLSAGIAITTPKYPIMKGAEESAKEEQNAKNHVCNNLGKNSTSFLGMALNWNHEFEAVDSLHNQINDLIQDNKLPKSFISKLLTHHANAKIANHIITNNKTYWMLTYDLSRMKERHKSSDAIKIIDQCIKEICNKSCGSLNGKAIITNYHPLELWAFAARWAELKFRTNK